MIDEYTPEEREALGRAMCEKVDEEILSQYIRPNITYGAKIIRHIDHHVFDEKLGWFRLKTPEELSG